MNLVQASLVRYMFIRNGMTTLHSVRWRCREVIVNIELSAGNHWGKARWLLPVLKYRQNNWLPCALFHYLFAAFDYYPSIALQDNYSFSNLTPLPVPRFWLFMEGQQGGFELMNSSARQPPAVPSVVSFSVKSANCVRIDDLSMLQYRH